MPALRPIKIEQGDELVISIRRTIVRIDEETKLEVSEVHSQELASVRCPQPCFIGGVGGTAEPEYLADDENEVRDRMFFRIRLPMRY